MSRKIRDGKIPGENFPEFPEIPEIGIFGFFQKRGVLGCNRWFPVFLGDPKIPENPRKNRGKFPVTFFPFFEISGIFFFDGFLTLFFKIFINFRSVAVYRFYKHHKFSEKSTIEKRWIFCRKNTLFFFLCRNFPPRTFSSPDPLKKRQNSMF